MRDGEEIERLLDPPRAHRAREIGRAFLLAAAALALVWQSFPFGSPYASPPPFRPTALRTPASPARDAAPPRDLVAGVWLPRAAAPYPYDALVALPAMPVPFDAVLTYRAALQSALRHIHGIDAVPFDGSDRRLSPTWEVRGGGGYFMLTFFADSTRGTRFGLTAGKLATEALLPAGGTPEAAARRAVEDAAELAAQFSARAQIVCTQTVSTTVAPAPSAPGSAAALAAALAPLRGTGRGVAPARLADAAYALAWTALFDAGAAPALPPRRAAQAVAYAVVAEQLAGHPLARARAAVWLAAGAADGDVWRFARTPPPGDAPELLPLHQAYRPDPLPAPGRDTSPAALYAITARAMATTDDATIARVCSSGAEPLEAQVFAGSSAGFAARMHGSTACARLAVDTALTAQRALGLTFDPVVRAALDGASRDPFHAAAAMLEGAHALAEQAAKAADPTERILLEEAADRLVHAVRAAGSGATFQGWTTVVEELQAAGRRTAERWHHPELAYHVLRWGKEPAPEAVEAYVRYPWIPFLALPQDYSYYAPMLDAAGPVAQLMHHPDSTQQLWRTVGALRAAGRDGLAIGLIERLRAREGADRAPFYGRGMVKVYPMLSAQLLDHAPAAFAALPWPTERAALERARRGDRAGARALLAGALARGPVPLDLAESLCWLDCDAGNPAGALDTARRFLAGDPPGLEGPTLVSEVCLRVAAAGHKEDALALSATAAQSGAAAPMETHALLLGAAGRREEALALLTGTEQHYPLTCAPARAAIEAVAAPSPQHWETLGNLLHRKNINFIRNIELMARTAGVSLPATPAGQLIATGARLDTLLRLARHDTLGGADLCALVAAIEPPGDAPRPLAEAFAPEREAIAGAALAAGASAEDLVRCHAIDVRTVDAAGSLVSDLASRGAPPSAQRALLAALRAHLPEPARTFVGALSDHDAFVSAWLSSYPGLNGTGIQRAIDRCRARGDLALQAALVRIVADALSACARTPAGAAPVVDRTLAAALVLAPAWSTESARLDPEVIALVARRGTSPALPLLEAALAAAAR